MPRPEDNIKHLLLELDLESKETDADTGFVLCQGIAARVGVQPYRNDELRPELRDSSVEFQAVYRDRDFLVQMCEVMCQGKIAITDEHHFLENGTNTDKIIGWVKDAKVADKDDMSYLIVYLTIFNPEIAQKIITGTEHIGLSLGYTSTVASCATARWVDTHGVVGAKNQSYPYNLVVKRPRVNHIAVCSLGRAGLATQVYADAMPLLADTTAEPPDRIEDQQKIYPYPDSANMLTEKQLQDALSAAMSQISDKFNSMEDRMVTKTCDALMPKLKDTLYGAFSGADFAAVIKQMFERDKTAADPDEQATQQQIMSVAHDKGFYKDSADFKSVIMDSLTVWQDLGPEAAALEGISSANTGDEIRVAWLSSKGIKLSDRASREDILSVYEGLRKTAKTEDTSVQVSDVKRFFDSLQGSTSQTIAGNSNIQRTPDGGVIYF
jgi:hypothetical protein